MAYPFGQIEKQENGCKWLLANRQGFEKVIPNEIAKLSEMTGKSYPQLVKKLSPIYVSNPGLGL